MKTFASRTPATKVLTSEPGKGPTLVDNRATAVTQRKMQATIASSPRQAAQGQPAPVQLAALRPNRTGLPDKLKAGVESLSGYSLDDVQVHYNSAKPAQLQAHAYAQGTDIHVAPGQEEHLPHEAWHVVQQKQGRVRPTTQLKSKVDVNDDAGLEREADVMGRQLLKAAPSASPNLTTGNYSEPNAKPDATLSPGKPKADSVATLHQLRLIGPGPSAGVVQRVLVPLKTPAAPTADHLNIIADANVIENLTDAAYTNTWNRLHDATAPVGTVPLNPIHFPGVTQGHFTHMVSSMSGDNDSLKAAAVGYVIEDQVTNGGIPATVTSQVASGNAIPDFVSTRGMARGVIDVTSSGQQGHVIDKDFNQAQFPYIAEATYPSIDFGALNGGAAPALNAAAATLAQQAMQRRANSYVGSRLHTLLETIGLFAGGIKWGDPPYLSAMADLRDEINALPGNAVWTDAQVANVDTLVAALNARLEPCYRQPMLSHIIANAQNKYLLVQGNPFW